MTGERSPSDATATATTEGGRVDAAAPGSARIGPTAHYTAYVWHRLGLPHAKHFKTATGRVLYWGFFAMGEWMTRLSPAVPTMRDYLEYRHRLIDAVVADEEPDLLVEVGAGLSRRGVTWAADHGIVVVEFDLPGMAAVKRRRVAALPAELRARMAGRHTVVDADVLAPDFATTLGVAIGGARRPVVIAEGLMSYFAAAERQRFLTAVAAGLRGAGGGLLICDTHTRSAQAKVGTAAKVLKAAIMTLTRRRRALGAYADEADLRQRFTAAGFDRVAVVAAEDHASAAPSLARLRSPAHVVTGRVTAG